MACILEGLAIKGCRSPLISAISKRPSLHTCAVWKLPSISTIIKARFLVNTAAPDVERLDPSILIEEETLRGYKAEHYYPVRLGQIFKNNFKVIGKLGYGSASTVWLCRDLRKSNGYIALKVYINCSKVHRELPIYEHINNIHSEHQGRDHVRRLVEAFEIEGPHGTHVCLAHQPLGLSLDEIRDGMPNGVLPADLVREVFRWILRGLEFLHQEAHVIHTDLQPNNMLMGVHDNSTFAEFERNEAESPCPRKITCDRTIYLSRPMPFSTGLPALSDLSEARFGELQHTDDIMPDVYRAPEVVLGMPWSYPVDIWALGMVIWDLFEGKRLFTARNPDGQYSERYHVAQMVAILGPPPLDFIRNSARSERFWDQDGKWINEIPIPEISLDSMEQRLEGEEKHQYIAFMKKMLQWKPEDRGNCRDIFFDEWLLADLVRAGVLSPKED